LAAVATEFGRREVSIAELRQDGLVGEDARIVVVTHRATDSALSDTVAALAGLDVVDEVTSVLRLEGTAE
jgi:homoserine dehydrogenase